MVSRRATERPEFIPGSLLATGGDGFTVFEDGQNVQTVGGDLEALVAYIESLSQPFTAPDDFGQRITTLN